MKGQKCSEILNQISEARQRALLLESVGVQLVSDRNVCQEIVSSISAPTDSWSQQMLLVQKGDRVALEVYS